MTMRRQPGLTLIELLAAVVILSAVAAAAARLTQETRAGVQATQLQLDAIAVMERWRLDHPELNGDTGAWSWTDENDRSWRISVSPEPLMTPPSASETALAIRWLRIEISCAREGVENIAMKILTMTPFPDDAASENDTWEHAP